jgi:ribosomal protein S27AE
MKKSPAPLRSLARRLVAIQAEARGLGMFVDDRELLACRRCGLTEDVSFAGLLITSCLPVLGEDTGLRFEEITSGKFRCPKCGATVTEASEKTASKTKQAKRKPRK